uniref:Uncharacterized protein n=1 Tax=Tanacetum cinerariifolium TaxID=118510 RepID=A0A6L2NXW4_TANCI|nr:hypothetical protein [Tanacetum cinerariifolium]
MLWRPHRQTPPLHHLHPPLRTIITIPNIKRPPSPCHYHLHRPPPPTTAAITNIITPYTTTAPPNTTSTAAAPSSSHHQGNTTKGALVLLSHHQGYVGFTQPPPRVRWFCSATTKGTLVLLSHHQGCVGFARPPPGVRLVLWLSPLGVRLVRCSTARKGAFGTVAR